MNVVIDNFTVSIVSFVEDTGKNVLIDHPTISLLITPNPGYSINAANFSGIDPLPQHVLSVEFFQSGANIECLVTFSSPFVMPDFDVFISLCLQGSSELSKYSIDGIVNFNLNNTSIPASIPPPPPIPYHGSGDFGDTLVIFTQAVVPITGGYFPTEPTLVLTIGNTARYNITSTKIYNINGQLTQVNFTVSYTFGKSSVSGDVLTLTASATTVYNPAIEITGYTFSLANVLPTGDSRTCTINGIPGAAYNLVYTDILGGIVDTFSGIIGPSGYYQFSVLFPPTSINNYYTFVLTGDLASSFDTTAGQPSTWIVLQLLQSSLFFQVTSANPYINTSVAQGQAYTPGQALDLIVPYTFVITSTKYMQLLVNPTVSGWTLPTVVALPNFNYDFEVISTSATINSTNDTLTLSMQAAISLSGSVAYTSLLNIDDYIITASIPTLDTKSITGDTVTEATTGGENILNNNAEITVKGVEWSDSLSFTTILGSTSDGSGDSDFDSLVTGLTPGDTYYVRAYAINIVGTGYGQVLPFVAVQPKNIPTVITTTVTFPADTTQALSGGNTINDDGQPITAKGVQWSSVSDFSTILGFTSNGTGNTDYSSTMASLVPGDTYYVRAYATSAVGTGYGNVITFNTSAYIPCGAQLSIPNGNTGLYQLQFETGSAVGASVIYFNPLGVPDGIRVTYDGSYYNAILGQNDGLKQGTAGNFTITGTVGQTCQNSKIGTYSYPFFDGYDNTGWLPGTPSTKSVTVAAGDIQLGNDNQYSAIVIPKPLPGPSLVTIEVLGPCSSTGWYLKFNCPVALPSFRGYSSGSGTDCAMGVTDYYFAQKYAGSLAYPGVNNWVFSDENGQYILPDGNYVMDNGRYITVVSGAVTASGYCT